MKRRLHEGNGANPPCPFVSVSFETKTLATCNSPPDDSSNPPLHSATLHSLSHCSLSLSRSFCPPPTFECCAWVLFFCVSVCCYFFRRSLDAFVASSCRCGTNCQIVKKKSALVKNADSVPPASQLIVSSVGCTRIPAQQGNAVARSSASDRAHRRQTRSNFSERCWKRRGH